MRLYFFVVLLFSVLVRAETNKTEVMFLSNDLKMTFPYQPKISSEEILFENKQKKGTRDHYICDDASVPVMIKVQDATFTPAGLENFKTKKAAFFKDTESALEKSLFADANVKISQRKNIKIGKLPAYKFGGESKEMKIQVLLVQKNTGIAMVIEIDKAKAKDKDSYLQTLKSVK